MTTQRNGKFEIVGGPGRYEMQAALFMSNQRIWFKFGGTAETLYHIGKLWLGVGPAFYTVELVGVSFCESNKDSCHFTVLFPSGHNMRTMVSGEYDLVTRKGHIDLTPICEIGKLPWNDQLGCCAHLDCDAPDCKLKAGWEVRNGADNIFLCDKCFEEHGGSGTKI